MVWFLFGEKETGLGLILDTPINAKKLLKADSEELILQDIEVAVSTSLGHLAEQIVVTQEAYWHLIPRNSIRLYAHVELMLRSP